jgi:hypothetical protein
MLIRGMEMNSGFAPRPAAIPTTAEPPTERFGRYPRPKHRVPANRGRRQLTTLRGCHSIGLADDPSMPTGWDRSPERRMS